MCIRDSYTPAEIEELLDLAADLKAKKKAGIRHNEQLAGKNLSLIHISMQCKMYIYSIRWFYYITNKLYFQGKVLRCV